MRWQTNRRTLLTATGGIGLSGLAGCLGNGGNGNGDGDGDGDGDDGGDDRTIELGLLMGVTGGLEELGPPIRDSSELVVSQIEEADTAFDIEVQFEDTGTEATQGINGAESLVAAGYPMFVGALASAVSLSVAEDVAIPNGVVQMSPASTAPDYTNLEGDFTFRTAVSDAFQGEVLARIASERLEVDSAATFAQDDAYGEGLASGFAEAFEDEHGGEITEEVIFTEGESSYTAQLEQALADDPGTILIVAFPEDGARIFRDFYSDFDRSDMPVLVADGLQDGGLPDDVGYDMTNVTGTAPIGEGPGVDFFNDYFEESLGEDPAGQPFVRQAYDAAAVLVLANAAAGENDGGAVRDQIRPVTDPGGDVVTPENLVDGIEMAAAGTDISYEGVSGEITFDENGDQEAVSYEYFEFVEGGLESVELIEL